jgi:hypothetical protein
MTSLRHGNGKNDISFWIATGRQGAPRNDDQNHGYDNGKSYGNDKSGKRL